MLTSMHAILAMQNVFFATAFLAIIGQVLAGGPEVCVSKGPATCVDHQVTKGSQTLSLVERIQTRERC